MALGVGQALAVGPVFLAIMQQAAARGVGAGCRVTLGATACDVLLLLPVVLFAGALGGIGGGARWLGALGAVCFVYLGQPRVSAIAALLFFVLAVQLVASTLPHFFAA